MPNDQANPQTTTTPAATTPTASTTPTPNPQPPAGNSPEARTQTGELIDQSRQSDDTTKAPEPEAGKEPAKSDAKAGVPESYTFAAGEDQHLDEAAIGEVTPIFKELGLDQAGVDKLTGFYNKKVGEFVQRGLDAVNTMREGWRNEISADPEIGSKLDSVRAEIGKLHTHLPPDLSAAFKDAMNLTGAGDHPGIVKGLYKIALLVNEGRPVPPGNNPSPHGQSKNGNGAPPSLASAMYPNLPSR